MTIREIKRRFIVTVDGKSISSGGVAVLVTDHEPPRTYLKDFQMTNDLDVFELLSSESDAVISAVIAGKKDLSIRDGEIVLNIATS